MAEVAKAAARAAPAFKLGRKEVFLPSHVITLLRKQHLPPNEACFKVPLRFTKFDIRDYLWNLYNVEVTKVRSYVKESPLAMRGLTRSTYRPQPSKIMTVELAKPFQWPEVPTDVESWNNRLWKLRESAKDENNEVQYKLQKFQTPLKSKAPLTKERKQLAELAKQMLEGEVKWSNDVALDPRWDKLMETKETKDAVDAAAVKKEAVKKEGETSDGTAKPS